MHILVDGKIVVDGDAELAKQLEADGYEKVLQGHGVELPVRHGGSETRSGVPGHGGDANKVMAKAGASA